VPGGAHRCSVLGGVRQASADLVQRHERARSVVDGDERARRVHQSQPVLHRVLAFGARVRKDNAWVRGSRRGDKVEVAELWRQHNDEAVEVVDRLQQLKGDLKDGLAVQFEELLRQRLAGAVFGTHTLARAAGQQHTRNALIIRQRRHNNRLRHARRGDAGRRADGERGAAREQRRGEEKSKRRHFGGFRNKRRPIFRSYF